MSDVWKVRLAGLLRLFCWSNLIGAGMHIEEGRMAYACVMAGYGLAAEFCANTLIYSCLRRTPAEPEKKGRE